MTDIYADLDTIAERFKNLGYGEDLAYEMAYAQIEQDDEEEDNG